MRIEVSETWDRFRAGEDGNGAKIVADGKCAQALMIPIAIRYRDHHPNSMRPVIFASLELEN